MASPDDNRMLNDAVNDLIVGLASLGVIVGTFLSYIPHILAGLATFLVVVHYLVLLYESKTFTEALARHRLKNEAQRAIAAVHMETREVRAQAAQAAEVLQHQAQVIADALKEHTPHD